MKGTTIVVNVHHGQMMPYSGAPVQFLDISGKLIHEPKKTKWDQFFRDQFFARAGKT